MRRGPDPRSMGISLAIHAILLVPLAVFARPPEPIQFETVRVNLVAAPEEVVQPQPAAAQPEPEPQPESAAPQPEPEPEAEAREQPPEPERDPEPDIEKPPETPEPRPEPTETPDSAAEAGGDLNVATEGREFPFPEYLGNVITQVNRYFRWNEDSRPRVTIYFEIVPDGTVRNIQIRDSSGNMRFDFAARGAVETAGRQGAFGPLPEGYAGPFLPVQLEIEPPR